jgi:transposase
LTASSTAGSRAVAWDAWERLGVMGLDELAHKRGHRAVVVVVPVALEGGGVEILAGLAGRPKETWGAFRRSRPETRRRTSECACTERDEGFVRALEEEEPWAEIVIERFQGARAYRDGADTVRQQELTRLKGGRWPFRKRPGELKPQAWERRARVFTCSPKIEAASNLREELTALFERGDRKAGATCAMRARCQRGRASGLAACESLLGPRDRGLEEITTAVMGRQTSGLVEGFNHRVKGLKRRCDGIFDVGSLFQRLTLAWHGYQRFGHT